MPDAEPDISPARWAGVGLVIAALLGAVVLAVVSPSVPSSVGSTVAVPDGPSPTPVASGPIDARLPVARPEISDPASGALVGDWEIEVGVTVPQDELRPKELSLVILSGEEEIGRLAKPKLGGSNMVTGVRLTEGFHELTAALEGPGGLGPRSEPVDVTMDRDAPKLEFTAPANKSTTFEDTVEVAGTSEVGAEVRLTNTTADWASPAFVVGPDGDFVWTVPLAKGRNEIAARSKNQAGRTQDDSIVVVRKDGKPKIKINAPKTLKGGSLPKTIEIVVDVGDTGGDAMAGAEVSYHLQGVGWPTETSESETNDDGRSSWKVVVKPVAGDYVSLAVSVTSPYGQTRTAKRQIKIE